MWVDDLEELPLDDVLPLWCEELYEEDDDTLLPFLPLAFELELLRIFSGVLSKSSCCCFDEWLLLLLEDVCTFSDRLADDSLELLAVLRELTSL